MGNEMTNDRSRLDFHMGEAFCRVASDYPTILDVILEQVQNAIDENAQHISVVLNRKTRHIAIRDDGNGTGVDRFEAALGTVCLSKKEQGKLGRFGIGLVSPLGKCKSSTFTSVERGSKGPYMEWTFVTADIRKQAKDVTIPRRERPDLSYTNEKGKAPVRGTTTVMWRTEVNILGYSEDKFIARITSIDALAESILDRFGAAMRKKDVELNLKFANEDGTTEVREGIKAKQFTGRPLGEVSIKEPDAGLVCFRMYLAPKTTKGQNGKIVVGESDDDYRFPMHYLVSSVAGLLSDEVAAAMTSGIFEGEITGQKVKLHVTRSKFEKDDALLGFCAAIETWYEEHGSKHLESAKEATRDARYQLLGQDSLREIEALLNTEDFADLRSVLNGFKIGSVGSGHAPRPEQAVVGKQSHPSVSTKLPKSGDSSERGGGDGDYERERLVDVPTHQPFTVTGPKGQRRTLVKGDSIGLQFSHIAMDGSDRLWELDTRQGILHFNVSHPTWVLCDVSDRKVRQLQETVALHALITEMMPEAEKNGIRMVFDETLPAVLRLYHASPAFTVGGKRKQA